MWYWWATTHLPGGEYFCGVKHSHFVLVREEEILQNVYFFINVLCFHRVCIINCANKLFSSISVSSGYENIHLHALHEGEYSAIFTSISGNSY